MVAFSSALRTSKRSTAENEQRRQQHPKQRCVCPPARECIQRCDKVGTLLKYIHCACFLPSMLCACCRALHATCAVYVVRDATHWIQCDVRCRNLLASWRYSKLLAVYNYAARRPCTHHIRHIRLCAALHSIECTSLVCVRRDSSLARGSTDRVRIIHVA